jgi:hypothetical protein
VSSWKIYPIAKFGLPSGVIKVANGFVVSLHNSASNAADPTLLTIRNVTAECVGGGYSRRDVTGIDWRAIEGGCRLVGSDLIWIAPNGDIADVAYAVASEQVTGTLLAYMRLENPITIQSNTALTIGLAAGVVELV